MELLIDEQGRSRIPFGRCALESSSSSSMRARRRPTQISQAREFLFVFGRRFFTWLQFDGSVWILLFGAEAVVRRPDVCAPSSVRPPRFKGA
jgi:hypothetical protein